MDRREKPVVIDVVAWICIQDRRLLCARTKGNDIFYLPGGKREPGESEREAVVREVKEEVAVSLVLETLTEMLVVKENAHGFAQPTRVRMTCFEAEYEGAIAPSAEIAEIAWFTMANIEKCAPANQRVLEYLYEHSLID